MIFILFSFQYLKHCDEVMVVEDGRIAEHGTHAELLANEGIYTEMFRIFDETSMKPITKQSKTEELRIIRYMFNTIIYKSMNTFVSRMKHITA